MKGWQLTSNLHGSRRALFSKPAPQFKTTQHDNHSLNFRVVTWGLHLAPLPFSSHPKWTQFVFFLEQEHCNNHHFKINADTITGDSLSAFRKATPGNLIWEACWKDCRSNWPRWFHWLPLAWAALQKSVPAGKQTAGSGSTYRKIKHFCLLLVCSPFGDVDLAHVGLRGSRLYRLCGPTVLEGVRDIKVLHGQHVLQGLHGGIQGFSHLGKHVDRKPLASGCIWHLQVLFLTITLFLPHKASRRQAGQRWSFPLYWCAK